MTRIDDDEIRSFPSAPAFERWLEKQGGRTTGIWLRIYKKASGEKTVTYAGALDVALCHGWIDGIRRKYDERSFIQRFSPRRARSGWSKTNVAHVERLTKAQRMRPAGHAVVEAAKADGRWERAYDSPANLQIPADFLRAVQRNKRAYKFFQSLNRQNQFAIAYRLHTARRPETRARRMEQFLKLLRAGRPILG